MTHSPDEAVDGVDCVVTGTWVSMNQEHRARAPQRTSGPYPVECTR